MGDSTPLASCGDGVMATISTLAKETRIGSRSRFASGTTTCAPLGMPHHATRKTFTRLVRNVEDVLHTPSRML